MSGPLTIAIPSKGRLMEATFEAFAGAGLSLKRLGSDRGYRAMIDGLAGVDVHLASASEIASDLARGHIHLGVTGEDLVSEIFPAGDVRVQNLKRLGFGGADVIVAVPKSWLDVSVMADLEEIAEAFQRTHGRSLRVATKYPRLSRAFFRNRGVSSYRIVESLGATEGTPAAGTAEIIVDITSSGSTLSANHLKILDDGLILKSEACLFASTLAPIDRASAELRKTVLDKLGVLA